MGHSFNERTFVFVAYRPGTKDIYYAEVISGSDPRAQMDAQEFLRNEQALYPSVGAFRDEHPYIFLTTTN